MNSLFVILLPSIVGTRIVSELTKNKEIKSMILNYLILLLFSNLLCFIVIYIFSSFDKNLILYIGSHLKFATKYILMSVVFNIILGFL